MRTITIPASFAAAASLIVVASAAVGPNLAISSKPGPEPSTTPIRGSGILYVDDSSTNGLNDGSSWENAFIHLQDAIANAGYGSGVTQIWVAEGTYKPDQGSNQTPGDLGASFTLPRNVSIYGGFAGTESSLDQRDPSAHRTVLSGDLHDDDDPRDLNSIIYNSVHVVAAYYAGTIDGVVITAGNATRESPWDSGGDGGRGGGAVAGGGTTFVNCTFEGNSGWLGGGLSAGSVSVVNCVFRQNRAMGNAYEGGVGLGGAIAADGGYATLTNCIIEGNKSTGYGGAIFAYRSHMTLTNCTIAGNSANKNGGGLTNSEAWTTISNTILWANRTAGTGGESGQLGVLSPVELRISYSCVEGWTGSLGGAGNIGNDPRFYRSPAGTLLDWFEVSPLEENAFMLTAGSSAIDAGDNLADMDAYLYGHQPIPGIEFDGLPRFLDDSRTPDTGAGGPPVVDMGAFEFQPEDCNRNRIHDNLDLDAGTSIDCDQTGVPDECEMDCNRSGVADACELASGSSADCDLNGVPDECEVDCNHNHIPDACDISEATNTDCNGNAVPDECDPAASLQVELTETDSELCPGPGWSVAIRGDWAILGGTDDVACVFHRGTAGWALEAGLSSTEVAWNAFFGYSVALGENLAVVGAPLDYEGDSDWRGAAYVFRRRAAGWIEEARLSVPGSNLYWNAGAISLSGNVIVLGAYEYSYGPYSPGAVYIFRYHPGPLARWIQEAKLMSPNPMEDDYFGLTVAVNANTLLVGAPGERLSADNWGAAHVFRRQEGAEGQWIHEARLVPPSTVNSFGSPVSLDGGLAAVGTSEASASRRVMVFRRNASTGLWHGEGILAPSDGSPGDEFAKSFAVSDGLVLVGAEGNDNPPYESGAAYLFRFDGSEWIQDAKLGRPSPVPWSRFGRSVSMDTGRALIGRSVFAVNGDCDADNVSDSCEIDSGMATDCDSNGLPDDCQPDCNSNGINDPCDISAGSTPDCNQNNTPDDCELDCNTNAIADTCDIVAGTSVDCQLNDIPDECDLAHGASPDCNHTAVPDECELAGQDCNANQIPDGCDLSAGTSADCNHNNLPDECDIATPNLVYDCNTNGVPDGCDLASGVSGDCDGNGVPDECDTEVCYPIWDGFEPDPPFSIGNQLYHLDYYGDGVEWNVSYDSWAMIASQGCPAGTGKALRSVSQSQPTEDAVVSEYFLPYDDGAPFQTLSIDVRSVAQLNPRIDWQLSLRDAASGEAVILMHWASTQSSFPGVTTAQGGDGRGRILVQNPAGDPPFINTGFVIRLNTCYNLTIALDSVTGATRLFIDGSLRLSTTRLHATALHMNYFRLEQEANGQVAGGLNGLSFDNFYLCRSGGAGGPVGLLDCDHNGIMDRCDLDSGTARDCEGNGIPDVCEHPADLDCDADVDSDDLAVFRDCHPVPAQPVPAECSAADLNADGRVDCADWRILRDAWTAGTPPNYPRCRTPSSVTPDNGD